VTVVSGVATFSGLNINLIGTNYTLTATSSPSYTSRASNAFNITTGAATQLVFTAQPSNGTAGSTMSPSTVVAVEDSNGNVVTTDNATQITLAITAGSGTNGAVLSGTKTVAVVSGVATFSGLSINLPGSNYTLTATSNPSYAAAICSGFNLSGPASKLAFTAQPSNGMAGTVLLTSPVVSVEDANGNVVANDNTTQITLAITSNTGTNGAVLNGVKTITVTSGVATFNGLSISLAGNAYTLTATSNPSFTLATSGSFSLSAAAAQLVFTASPSNGAVGSVFSSQPVVQVEDIFGNIVTTDNTTQVTLAVTLGTGTYGAVLSGTTTMTVASGVASFSGLAINLAGINYTLTATSNPSYVSAISNSFSLNNGNHTFNVTSNTDWSAIKDGIYGPPAAGDTVIVSNGATVNVDMSNAMAATLQLGGTASKSGDGTLTFSSSSTNLTVSSSLIFGNTATGANKTQGNINMSSGATLQINGSIVVNTPGTWTPGTGTVIYGASGAQTIDTAFFASYYNLTFSGSGVKTTTGVIVNGILTMSGTATVSTALTYGSTPTLVYAGNGAQTTGPELPTTFSGGIIINNANRVNLNSSATLSGTLTLNYGTFAVGSNTLTLNGPAIAGTPAILSTSSSSSLVFGGGSTGVTIPASVTALKNLTISNSNGVAAGTNFTVAGTLTISSGATLSLSTYTLSSVATLSNSGTIETQNTSSTPLPVGLTWGGTVLYDATAAQTVVAGTYNNLTLSGSGAKTLPVALTSVGGNLTLSGTATTTTVVGITISGNLNVGDGTTFTAAGYALTVTGTTTVGNGTSGTLTISSAAGTKTFNGDIVVATGATWNNTAANASLALPGNLTNNGTFNAGTGVYTLSGSSKTITGMLSIPSVTVSGTYTNNGTLTVGTALAGTGTLINGTTGTLNIGGSSGITTLTASVTGNAVNYTGAGQIVHSNNYYNLTLSGSGAETLQTGTTAIGGNLTLSGTATATTGAALTISGNLNVGDGTTFTAAGYALTVTGTTTIGNGTSGSLAISSATGTKTFTGAVIINSGGAIIESAAAALSFGSNVTINGTLTEYGAAVVGIAGSFTNNGTYTASTGTHTFSGATQTIGGTNAISIPTATFTGAYTNSGTLTNGTLLTVTGVTLTNNGTITASTALSGTGGVTQGTTGTLNIGGTSTITSLTTTATGNTVNYNGANQTVVATPYYNLGLSGSSTKTLGAAVTVNGTFTKATNTAVSLAASQDSYIDQANASTNYGSSTTLKAGAASSKYQEASLQFAIPSFIKGTFTSATLKLYASAASSNSVNVYSLITAWTGSSVKWNTPWSSGPVAGTNYNSSATASLASITASYNSFNVTSDLTAFLSGTTNNGWLVTSVATTDIQFYSVENGSNTPQLIVQ
jgi:fibronectin-binding autotransporter adhesin